MSEKLYLPVSVLLSALVIAGSIFFVGADISNKVSGLTVAVPSAGSGSGNTVGVANPPVGAAPTQPIVPDAGPVNMVSLLEGAQLLYGSDSAPIKIVEFSDFECPFCGRASPTVKALATKYGDKVQIKYRHFPLSFHPSARPAALASECAAEQGKFAEYHDKLFENQQALLGASLKQYAVDLGLNTQAFNDCLDSERYAQKVDNDTALGSSSGVDGTPTFFINGQRIVGAQPQTKFEQLIDQELA